MKTTPQTQELANSVNLATTVFNACQVEYRILGSVLIVSHTGKLFRRIGDLDILLDESKKACVFGKLKEMGVELVARRWLNFSWTETRKDGYLGLTFLLVGKFNKEYFSYRFLKVCELRINADYLTPTTYCFHGINFIGIPISSAVAGIRKSLLNPKRKLDQEVLGEDFTKSKTRTYNCINVYVFGIKIPFLYDVFSCLYNIYGGLRVKFGRKYEVWD
ncbi:MAG: hypothetical protein M1383_01510 [Patescibacteria group bacterium]|nr:hypothetical protein [Patescibacteria group bacterium]